MRSSSASSACALVYDLSATPFFLRGSGYAEGTLFPWTISDFSLMDAIECGIVKLPRVPVADNIPGGDAPKFRNLWERYRQRRCRRRAGGTSGKELDPLSLPAELQTALEALYGHYQKTFELWADGRHRRPAGLHRRLQQHLDLGTRLRIHLRLPPRKRRRLDHARKRPAGAVPQLRRARQPPGTRPNTMLIDSEQLESGEALDKDFRAMAADEIEQFRREIDRAHGRRAGRGRRSTMRRSCAR